MRRTLTRPGRRGGWLPLPSRCPSSACIGLNFATLFGSASFGRRLIRVSGNARCGSTDLAARILLPVEPAWSEVLTEAERLSAGHTERVGTWSLDILHVASAVVLGMPQFLTFDTRQADLASSAGLRVLRP